MQKKIFVSAYTKKRRESTEKRNKIERREHGTRERKRRERQSQEKERETEKDRKGPILAPCVDFPPLLFFNTDIMSLSVFSSDPSPRAPVLMTSRFAPLLSFRGGTVAVAGAEDGTLVFFDLERSGDGSKCVVNKLLGHSKPLMALGFSHDEAFVASADTSGQVIVWKK